MWTDRKRLNFPRLQVGKLIRNSRVCRVIILVNAIGIGARKQSHRVDIQRFELSFRERSGEHRFLRVCATYSRGIRVVPAACEQASDIQCGDCFRWGIARSLFQSSPGAGWIGPAKGGNRRSYAGAELGIVGDSPLLLALAVEAIAGGRCWSCFGPRRRLALDTPR